MKIVAGDTMSPAEDGALPPVPAQRFETSLALSAEQESTIVQRALERINDLKSEMGLDTGGGCVPYSWMWRRQKNQWEYDNEWEFREKFIGPGTGGIFERSNFSINISKRFARLIAARTSDDLVGTEPFFATMPTEHSDDDQLSKQLEAYLQDKFANSNIRSSLQEAELMAVVRNEAVVKTSYVIDSTHFRGSATVMVQGDGTPFVTPNGQYVYQKDDVIASPLVEGEFLLKKEPGVVMPQAPQFAIFNDLDQNLLNYEGLDVRTLDYRDFLCPLNVNSIHEADICVHLFDELKERMEQTYGAFDVSQSYFSTDVLSGQRQPKVEQGEQESASKILEYGHYADVYMRVPIAEHTSPVEVWMVLDVTAQKAVWYDYLGNHMRQRPFEVIPGIEKVPGRWYGTGVFEMLAHKQLYIDTQFNRVNYKSSKNSSVRFRIKHAVEEWKAGEDMVVGGDEFYNITNPNYDAKNPPVFQVNLMEIDQYGMDLMKLMLQAGSNEVGIAGPNDAEIAGLDTVKLATGIKSLERTGNTLMKYTERSHGDAIGAILWQCVNTQIEHMSQNELIFREDSSELVQLNREECRLIKKDVRLLLSRSRSTETLETSQAVVNLMKDYYGLTPLMQYYLRDEYVRQLKALEVQDADERLVKVSKQQMEDWVAAQARAAVLVPKTSIASKIPLYPSERDQIVQREGITPASAEEKAAQDQAEVKKEGDIAKAKAEAKPETRPADGKRTSTATKSK
jgi:hypothetical protein